MRNITLLCAAALLLRALSLPAQVPDLMNYQGHLVTSSGTNIDDGNYDLTFRIFSADAGGTTNWGPQQFAGVPVVNGRFNLMLGPTDAANRKLATAFSNDFAFLEIQIGVNSPIQPRQQILSTPFAFKAADSQNLAGTNWSALFNNGNPATGKIFVDRIPSGPGSFLNADRLDGLESSLLWKLEGNSGATPNNFLGTTDGQPLEFRVNNQRALRLEYVLGTANVIGGSRHNTVSSGAYGVTIAGGGSSSTSNSVAAPYGTISGGQNHTIQVDADHCTISGGESNVIQNAADHSTISGGRYGIIESNAEYSTISGGFQNRIHTSANYSTISGGGNNTVQTNAVSSTIAGGNLNTIQRNAESATISGGNNNIIQQNGDGSTIAGGRQNVVWTNAADSTISGGLANSIQIFAFLSTVAGGFGNTIHSNAFYSTISGGANNTIQTNAVVSTISGGQQNTIQSNAIYSTISGGWRNATLPDAAFATIPGGDRNTATNRAFAAGTRAKAIHTGAFVWCDHQELDMASTNANSMTIRASGGYRFFVGGGTGVYLAPFTGSWTTLSDRNLKENFEPVDVHAVLDKVAALPLSTWNYRGQTNGVRHIGPMAQDFKAAFGVGAGDTGITTVDADGVALAAIQALNEIVTNQKARIDDQNEKLRALEATVMVLQEKLVSIEARILPAIKEAAIEKTPPQAGSF